jgi:ferritin-like metal-binding protein YciE
MATMTEPRQLFVEELQDLFYAEKTIEKRLPKLAREAHDRELARGFEQHLKQTRQQIANLEQTFAKLGERAKGKPCAGIDGLKEEHDAFMSESDPSPLIRDLFLTGAAARTEHYEIAAYTGLVTMASALGETECRKLLQANLTQEKETLRKFESISKRLAKAGNGTRRTQ